MWVENNVFLNDIESFIIKNLIGIKILIIGVSQLEKNQPFLPKPLPINDWKSFFLKQFYLGF